MKLKKIWAVIVLLSVVPGVAVSPRRTAAAVSANVIFV